MSIWVVPFFGQGHLLPSIELCKILSSLNYQTTLFISSHLSSFIPPTQNKFAIVQIQSPPPEPPRPGSNMHDHKHNPMFQALQDLVSARAGDPNLSPPLCVVLDVMMGWAKDVFKGFRIPVVAWFTSGACSAAMEYALWKAHPVHIQPGKIHFLPGLPEEMAINESDLKHKPRGPPGGPGGPPGRPGSPPNPFQHGPPHPNKPNTPPSVGAPPGPVPWVEESNDSIALIMNTCDDLERPFIDYLINQIKKPVWGIGPLLPDHYWNSGNPLEETTRTTRKSSVTEEEVIQWLDSNPRGSVIYIAFGTEVGPTIEEYRYLADALETSTRSFIWVIQPGSGKPGPPRHHGSLDQEEGYFPHRLAEKVGQRGLIISGWAPQLLILRHESTGGFISHCGWNSTVEAVVRGVPLLAWPIRGDQFYNAKLVVNYHKIGFMICDDFSREVKKEDIINGIEKLMCDKSVRERAAMIKAGFENGFPKSAVTAFDEFKDFISKNVV